MTKPSNPEHFYLTTPIYYVNARPHMGRRLLDHRSATPSHRKRALGIETWFLTGTDEHGQKIERSSKLAGCTPQEFTTRIADEYRSLWDWLGLTNDDFILNYIRAPYPWGTKTVYCPAAARLHLQRVVYRPVLRELRRVDRGAPGNGLHDSRHRDRDSERRELLL